MDYQRLILVGNTTADAERRQSHNGEVNYTTFRLAVGDAKGDTIYFPVTVFGQQGEAVAEHLTKGRQVLVEGRLDVAKNGRFNVVARRVVFGKMPEPVTTGQ